MASCFILNWLGMSYSGDKRQLEVSEALRSGPLTMIRRNGCLTGRSRPYHTKVSSSASASPPKSSVEVAWREWVAEESVKRLGYCAYVSHGLAFSSKEESNIAYFILLVCRCNDINAPRLHTIHVGY
jgi:hypothetical protein